MQGQEGDVRAPYRDYRIWYDAEEPARIHRKAQQAEAFFRTTGITFNVYGEDDADERLIPFDVVPRIISAGEWRGRLRRHPPPGGILPAPRRPVTLPPVHEPM